MRLPILVIKKIPKVGSNYTCLPVILFDFVPKKDENYYPEVLLKTYKCIKKNDKIHCKGDWINY